MNDGAVRSHAPITRPSYNRGVLPVPRTARTPRRRLMMRAATLLLATIVTVVGLWGASHADDLGFAAPATSSAASPAAAPGEDVVESVTEAAVDGAAVIGVITCILGILCGVALGALLVCALRFRLVRLHQLRPRPGPSTFSSAFGHRGRHRFGLLELNLLRI